MRNAWSQHMHSIHTLPRLTFPPGHRDTSRDQICTATQIPPAIDALLERELQNGTFCSESISQNSAIRVHSAQEVETGITSYVKAPSTRGSEAQRGVCIHGLASQAQASCILKAHLQRKHRLPEVCRTPWDTLFPKPCHLWLDPQTDKGHRESLLNLVWSQVAAPCSYNIKEWHRGPKELKA